MEDSTAMTIEFLRARLLAERSVSRTARQRADELAQRVMELEEQLKIASLQRKKAEKATADVLAILENHGRSDVSETFDSSSDQEAEVGTSSVKGKEPSSNGKLGENDMDTFSGSERESSTPIGRSLSWKSSRDSLHSLEKKYMDSSRRRRSSFASSGSSSPKRVGKSCRQIRRREHRSAVEESQNDSRNAPPEDEVGTSSGDVHTCSDIGPGTFREGPENSDERDLRDVPVTVVWESRSASNGHYLNNDRGNRDMERALQHQERLIGQFEAEEKAQREWEEKFRENNGSTPDSCDPGNHSDVTEERDEIKAPAPPFSNGITTSQNQEDEFRAGDACYNKELKPPSVQPSEGKGDEDNLDSRQHLPLHGSHHSPDLRDMPVNDSAHVSSSEVSSLYRGEAPEIANEFALMPQENSDKLGSVLEALQLAKLSIKQNLKRLPLLEDGPIQRAIESSLPAARYGDRYAMPVGSVGLFRLPTDYQYGATSRVNSFGSGSRLSMSNYSPGPAGVSIFSSPYTESKSSSFNDDRFLTVPTFPYLEIRSRIPTRPPVFESGLDAALPSFSNRYTNLDPHSSAGLPTRPPVFDPSLNAGLPPFGGYTSLDPHLSADLLTGPPIFEPGPPSFGRYSNLDPHSSAGLPSSSKFTNTTRPSNPDSIPRTPSDGGLPNFISNIDFGLPPSRFSY